MENENIGNLISKIRKEKGMTQKDLALKLNVTDRAVSKWERGLCCPDISLLKDLSNILDISISKLICGEEIPDETINRTIEYTEKNIKIKIRNYFIIIIIILCGLVLFNILKIELRYYKKYNFSTEYVAMIDANIENDLKKINDVKNKLNIILNNQGIYNNDDYNKILNYVKYIEQVLLLNENDFLKKEYYTIEDIKILKNNYYNYNDGYLEFSVTDSIDIYYLLVKYNSNKSKNIRDCNNYINNHWTFKGNIYSIINNISLYNYNIPKNIADIIYEELNNRYNLYLLVLTDIIEVGEIDELN